MTARTVAAAAALTGAAVVSILYGLTFGFTYGVNNQTAYMLASLRMLDRSVLANDWYAAHTLNYHPAFAFVGWLLLLVGGRGGWGVGVATVAVAAAGAMCVRWLARSLLPEAVATPAFLLTLAAMITTGTREMAVSYVFDPIFQPSTLASLALLAAFAPFVAGRWLLSGILLAIAGLFHANYLVLGLATFGVAHLTLGRTDFKQRVLRQLGPPLVVMLLLSPVMFKALHATASDAARAQEILFDIRSPHHYRPRDYLNDFFPFLAWQALGLGVGAWVLRRAEGRGRRFAAIVIGLLAVVWSGTVLSIVFESRRATQLFVWRFAPFVDVLMQLLIAATVVRLVTTPREPLRLTRAQAAVALVGGAGLAVSLATRSPPTVEWLEWMSGAALLGVISRLAPRYVRGPAERVHAFLSDHGRWVAIAAGVALFAVTVRPPLKELEPHSNLLTGMRGPESDMYAWIRDNTPKDAVFLSPPGLERFRLAAERAIVVDWKGSTYVPSELVEWYTRLEDVSGRRGFRTRDDALAGYEAMDQTRLEHLRDKYDLRYAVVTRGREGALGGHAVYANSRLVVLDLR